MDTCLFFGSVLIIRMARRHQKFFRIDFYCLHVISLNIQLIAKAANLSSSIRNASITAKLMRGIAFILLDDREYHIIETHSSMLVFNNS